MEQIDWSKAPDWAIGHAIHATAMGVKEVWVGEDKYQQFDHQRPFPYGGTVGADSFHNPRRNQFAFETLRPAPWTGAGLPPVGTVCEMRRTDYVDVDWQRIEFLCAGSKKAFFRDRDGYEWSKPLGDLKFRPIRTTEQIAADQRDKDLNEMIRVIKDHPAGRHGVNHLQQLRIQEEACIDLYAHGYRKFEIVPE